jgi:hypothetical protein
MGGDVKNDTVVLVKDLPSYGTSYSTNHIMRLVKAGAFSVPFKLSDFRNGWWKSEILSHLRERSATTHGQVSEKLREASRKGVEARAAARAKRKAANAAAYAEGSRHAQTHEA